MRSLRTRLAVTLVLLDVMLPRLDGLEVLRAIRNEATTPVVMLTARADTIDVVVGLESGADDYVRKPFEPRQHHVEQHEVRPLAPPARQAVGAVDRCLDLEPGAPQPERGDLPDRRVVLDQQDAGVHR